jgi:hypothetical protein
MILRRLLKDRDADGYRELPDGNPLTVVLASRTDAVARTSDELWKRNMDAIGIRVTFLKNKMPELIKMSEAGQLMMWGASWDTLDLPVQPWIKGFKQNALTQPQWRYCDSTR